MSINVCLATWTLWVRVNVNASNAYGGMDLDNAIYIAEASTENETINFGLLIKPIHGCQAKCRPQLLSDFFFKFKFIKIFKCTL